MLGIFGWEVESLLTVGGHHLATPSTSNILSPTMSKSYYTYTYPISLRLKYIDLIAKCFPIGCSAGQTQPPTINIGDSRQRTYATELIS